MSALSRIQSQLQTTYDVAVAQRVDDYLITDRVAAAALTPEGECRNNDERLLLAQPDVDTLELSLFIDQSVLKRLKRCNPWQQLDRNNLDAFMLAIEGVSHFLYLVWNATHARPVSRLELELQAEVDKFVTARQLFRQQHKVPPDRALYRCLFLQCQWRLDSDPSLSRYRLASRLAAEFCASLLNRRYGRIGSPGASAALRRFYRLTHHQKLRQTDL